MTSSISEYYSRELKEWIDSIDFYLADMPEFEERLSEFLQHDSMPKMAARVEHFLNNFLLYKQNFILLAENIDKQESALVSDNAPVENVAVTLEIKAIQRSLRAKMKEAERNYIDLKYDSFYFFAEILNAQ